MAKRTTLAGFIEKAKLVHEDKYDYSKVNYVNNSTKVTIICPTHGEFDQRPDDHTLRKAGCKTCGAESRRLKRVLNTKEFITRAINVHGEGYNYDKTKYIDDRTKVLIICPEHGEFSQKPGDHVRSAQGCPKCAGKDVTTEEFTEKAISVHGEKYTYEKVNYINNHVKVVITCPEHGDFQQTPNNHLSGSGCYLCPTRASSGFDPGKAAVLYYLKITTEKGQKLYKIGITNRTVKERFNLTDLKKIEVVKQKLYQNGAHALEWEQKLLKLYKSYQYKGPNMLESGNTELFTEDILKLWYSR